MTNHCVFVIFGILAVVPIFGIARDLESEPPVLKLYEVDENNNIVRLYDRVDNELSEVIIENVNHIRLECQAYYPVQWIYTGNGIPILSTYIALSTTQEKSETIEQYTASAFLSPLKEYHTGTYQCSHTEYLTLSPNIHIYVPGPALFSSLHGEKIQIPKNDSSVLIPCSVSHPRVQVSLEKVDKKGFRNPVSKSDDTVMYDPRKGFRVNWNKIADPEGTYICIARYKKRVRGIDYYVTKSAEYGEFRQTPEERCTGESCGRNCETHSDCPSMMNCYTDRLCRDPCSYSIRCGTESKCRVIDNVPECYCPPGFVGDATKECINR